MSSSFYLPLLLVSFALGSFFILYIYICILLVKSVLVLIFFNYFCRSVLFSFGYFKKLLTLELLSSNRSVCHKRGSKRMMRPAIQQAQDVLNWWVGPVARV